ncbi:MAG: pyridoxamine 5'-phosphate oxidase family protein [Thermoplasmatota archaeon]
MAPAGTPSERTKVRRVAERGAYNQETIHAILKEGLVAHVGLATEHGPVVIPMAYGLDAPANRLILHGSGASRLMQGLRAGVPACVTVTHVDGLVLARSAFNHSMNYRSVVALGTLRAVEGEAEQQEALRVLTEHLAPGRWDHVRPPSELEMKATMVLTMDLKEASAKVRQGPPGDDPDDMELPVWAGVIPLPVVPGAPEQDPVQALMDVPRHVAEWADAKGLAPRPPSQA